MKNLKFMYNSNGKVFGEAIKEENHIIINNYKKPLLIIDEPKILQCFNSRNIRDEEIILLWDEYGLTIGEIAAIAGYTYSNINKRLKKLPVQTGKSQGRRNSSFEAHFTPERCANISQGRRQSYQKNGYNGGKYERTDKIKQKISQGVKAAHARGDLNGAENARKGWANGKYANVNFKRGIGGYITSKKTGKRFFFRSLLELCFILYLEKSSKVYYYEYEPIHIKCKNGSIYTPDFLINNKYLIELKSYNFIYKQKGSIQKKFEEKCQYGKEYAEEHNLIFKVIFDKDINFESASYKHIIKNSEDLITYNIIFTQPERVWSKK